MIEKDNLFELLGSSTTKYHTAVFTSYSFDPLYFNNLFLPNLNRRGITNVIVLLDSATYDSMLQDYGRYGNFLEYDGYTLLRQESVGNGVFHSKIALFFGFEEAMVYVGSGNLTYSGQTLNEEVWGAVNVTSSDNRNFPFLHSVWEYLKRLMPNDSELVGQQISWINQYSPWLVQLEGLNDIMCYTEQNEEFGFIFNSENNSILAQLESRLAGIKVSSIEIVSPFYDSLGWLVEEFGKAFEPDSFTCWISNSGTSPRNMSEFSSCKFVAWKHTDEGLKEHLHAKIYQFQTNKGTFLLLGSANATHNAWGDSKHVFNDEAMILFHNPKHSDYLKQLGIDIEHSGTVSPEVHENVQKERKTLCVSKIYHAEVVGDFLSIKGSQLNNGQYILLLNKTSETIAQYPMSEKIRITEEEKDKLCMVVLSDGDKEISNRCLVILEDTLVKNDPNPKKSKLRSLLNSSIQWDDNIAKILAFVTLETASEPKKVVKPVLGKSEDIRADVQLDAMAYQEVSLKGKSSILAMDNIRVADFLLSALFTKKDNSVLDESEAGENASEEDMNSGKLQGSQEEDRVKEIERVHLRKRSAIITFLNRYISSETHKLEQFESKMWKNQDTRYPDYYIEYLKKAPFDRTNGTLEEYSAALIASSMICNEIMHANMNESDARYYLLTSIGKFLLLHGGGYEKSDNYAYTKKNRMHKDIVITSLLSFAQLHWSTIDSYSSYGELLLLNLMSSFNDFEDVKDTFKNYRRIVRKFQYPLNKNSLAIIEDFYCQYKKFRSVERKEYIESIKDSWKEAFIWKSSVGFVLISDMKKNVSDKMIKWKYSITTSGYVGEKQEYFVTEAGEKVVLLLAYI